MDSYGLNTTFFAINNTESIFPKLNYKKEFMPAGDSIVMCLAMYWGKGASTGYSFMKLVDGFPKCSMVEGGKFIWNTEDSTDGIDVPVWKQYTHEADCNEDNCDKYCRNKFNGYYVGGRKEKLCYSYDVLKKICLVMKYDKNKNIFTFSEGCFEDGKAYEMEPAEMEKVYDFENVEITVREEEDPLIHAGKISKHSYRFGSSWRYFAVFLNILLLANIGFLAYTIYLIFKIRKAGKAELMEDKGDGIQE